MIELDVTDPEHLAALPDRLREHVDGLDGVLHSIGFAPEAALGGNFLNTAWEDVATAVHVSAYSLKSLTVACLPLMTEGGASRRRPGLRRRCRVAEVRLDGRGEGGAWSRLPATSPATSGPQGVRVNLVAAGPIRTMAAKSIPGFDEFEGVWEARAPLGWDLDDPEPAARACVALLSDWFPATTGEIVHVDGGVHAIGG